MNDVYPPTPEPCSPTTPHDDAFESCYSWCEAHPETNCERCKCKSCGFCRNPVVHPPPPAPKHAVLPVEASSAIHSVACTPNTPYDSEWESCFDWCPLHVDVNCERCKCKACPICRHGISSQQQPSPVRHSATPWPPPPHVVRANAKAPPLTGQPIPPEASGAYAVNSAALTNELVGAIGATMLLVGCVCFALSKVGSRISSITLSRRHHRHMAHIALEGEPTAGDGVTGDAAPSTETRTQRFISVAMTPLRVIRRWVGVVQLSKRHQPRAAQEPRCFMPILGPTIPMSELSSDCAEPPTSNVGAPETSPAGASRRGAMFTQEVLQRNAGPAMVLRRHQLECAATRS